MKVWMKISLLCMALYILVLGTSGVIMIQKNYSDALTKEIQASLNEEEYAQKIADSYISMEIGNIMSENKNQAETPRMDLNAGVYREVLDLVKPKGTWLELYDEKKRLLSSDFPMDLCLKRDEIDRALMGENNYVIRKYKGNSYLITSGALQNSHAISLIKDITYISEKKREEYLFFFRLLVLGLALLAIIAPFMSRYITIPIVKLTDSAGKIINGNYSDRVQIKGKDEINDLAVQFNIMASEIERRIIELTEQGEKKQRFIDDLIHEIRTPLTSIIGYSDFLMRNGFTKEILHNSLSNINTEGKRLLDSAEKLMNLILLNNHGILHRNTLKIRDLFEEISSDMNPGLSEKGITLSIDASDEELNADRDLIKSVLTNLIENSIRASERDSSIIIGAYTSEGKVILFVQDQGKGIPENELNKILEPFYRIDKARSRKDGGAGLGLAICSEIIKAHGAELQIESIVGQGTIVRIVFK